LVGDDTFLFFVSFYSSVSLSTVGDTCRPLVVLALFPDFKLNFLDEKIFLDVVNRLDLLPILVRPKPNPEPLLDWSF
jgi:hypothetical protein